MATLNRAQNLISLRIVYDGPGRAGKTTTLRALSERLELSCHTPKEIDGRTLYFDWFSYRGGLFDGCQLDCQVVSVPGQATLKQRRDYLLKTADAIVYVAPVTETTLANCISALREHQRSELTLGVVFQINKRDQPDALPLHQIKEALNLAGLTPAVVETRATEGAGVRETFVFAVRLALDRIREQMERGTLPLGDPAVASADDLLAHMRTNEAAKLRSVPTQSFGTSAPNSSTINALEQLFAETSSSSSRPSPPPGRKEAPRPPEANVPSGHIWPPIEGRICLRDATDCELRLEEVDGDWWASTSTGWRFFSPENNRFQEAEEGRHELIELARRHAALATVLSGPRCLVLTPDHGGKWRLWQVVRERLSMRDRLSTLIGESDEAEIARLLADTTRRLLELRSSLSALPNSSARATLDTTGVFMGKTHYVGLLHQEANDKGTASPSLEQELGEVLCDWSHRGEGITAALSRLATGAMTEEFEIPLRLLSKLTKARP